MQLQDATKVSKWNMQLNNYYLCFTLIFQYCLKLPVKKKLLKVTNFILCYGYQKRQFNQFLKNTRKTESITALREKRTTMFKD